MADGATIEHVTSEELAGYFQGMLPDDRECAIEEHLAECEQCTEQARQVCVFIEAWEQWTPQAHGQAYWRTRVAEAIETAERRYPVWRERLARWQERWVYMAEAAVRVVVGAPEKASRIMTEGLETLTRPGALWKFAPVPVSAGIRNAELVGAVPAPTVALAAGRPQAQVAVSSDTREVVVRVDDLRRGQTPPLVLLVPAGEGREPLVAEPQKQPGVDFLIARFENVEPGEYLATFEPLE